MIEKIPWHPTNLQLRQFAGLLMLFAVAAGSFLWLRGADFTTVAFIVVVGLMIGVTGLALPASIRGLFVGWMIAAWPIGWLISHLLLAGVFFLVVTPIGLALRVCGRDPLHRRWDHRAKTYWIARQPSSDSRRYFQQF
jgi:hypothetical protein